MWQKGMSWEEATSFSKEIRLVTLSIVDLCLAEAMSQSVRQSIGWSVSQ